VRLALGAAAVRAGIESAGLLALALAADFALGRAGPSVLTLPGAALRIGIPALGLLGAGVAILRIRDRLPVDRAEGTA
jgi:hypothetical protein